MVDVRWAHSIQNGAVWLRTGSRKNLAATLRTALLRRFESSRVDIEISVLILEYMVRQASALFSLKTFWIGIGIDAIEFTEFAHFLQTNLLHILKWICDLKDCSFLHFRQKKTFMRNEWGSESLRKDFTD